MDISEDDFKKCTSCNASLCGKVKFCPYCGRSANTDESIPLQDEVAKSAPVSSNQEKSTQNPIPETAPIKESSKEEQINKDPDNLEKPRMLVDSILQRDDKVITSDGGVASMDQNSSTNSNRRGSTTRWLTGVIIAMALVVIAVATTTSDFFSNKIKVEKENTITVTQLPEGSTPSSGKRDSARIQALDTLRAGTDLSVKISTIPKLEKVLEAAQKLLTISPRYQGEVTISEANLETVQRDRDKKLLLYLGKLSELNRYTSDEISYALGVIQNGDLSSREEKVMDLLTVHSTTSLNTKSLNPEKILSDFNHNFVDFIE